MAELAFREGIMDRIRIREPRFDEQAYLFVLSALEMCQAQLTMRRHITGIELANACRDLALDRYGLMAKVVLEHWEFLPLPISGTSCSPWWTSDFCSVSRRTPATSSLTFSISIGHSSAITPGTARDRRSTQVKQCPSGWSAPGNQRSAIRRQLKEEFLPAC